MPAAADRPAPVHVDDLANPTFPPEIAEMIEAAGAFAAEVELGTDALIAQATAETGLEDFGPDDFRERLDLLLWSLHHEATLSPMGTVTQSVQLGQLLKNRLLLADLLDRHPEIHDIEIAAPIVIAGLPRTGTTHLHNLISADPALRSLPYWESMEPVLGADEAAAVAAGAPDPRRERTEAGLAFINTAMPYFPRMHEMTVDHVHEEVQLLAIDFSTMLFETMAPIPTWRDHYLTHDQTPHYEYLKTVLKVLQWSRGGERWVLKSPQHLEQFAALLATFPDATVVVTHRDAVSVSASMATMLAYTARLSFDPVDPEHIGAYWVDRLDRMLTACSDDRSLLPEAQSIDVHFDEFMADDVAMVERIYRLAGQPMTASSREALDRYQVEHPRGRHGGLIYDLADFGLDASDLYQRFDAYHRAFGVTSEHFGGA